MTLIRTLTLIAATVLLITACSKDSDGTDSAVKENTNPLLAYVPVDTAYVFAALEPAPRNVTDAYTSRFQPVWDVVSENVRQFQLDYKAGQYEDNEMARFAVTVLDELGGNLDSEAFNKIGITLQAHHVFYAMGLFPTIRIELDDAQKLRNTIARVEEKMGYELPLHHLNGVDYWRINSQEMGLYISILDQQLAFSVFPIAAEDTLLAALLGQDMPTPSMASNNTVAIMNNKNAYTGYGSGILDLQKLADEMLNPNSTTLRSLGPATELGFDPVSMAPVCIEEIKSIVAKAPIMTIGITKLAANEINMRYHLEIEDTLASSLAGLVSDTPSAESGDHVVAGSLAIRIGKLRNFVLEKFNEIAGSPYQCETLQELNKTAAELVTQLNIPMPPMINNLMGVRFRLDTIDLSGDIPKGDGMLAIHVDKPEMFVGMASMMVPGFDTLDLANQSEPVRIPPEILHMDHPDVFALMGKNAIGASFGEHDTQYLGKFLTAKPQREGVFFSLSYDIAKQLELETEISQKLSYQPGGNRSGHDQLTETFHQTLENVFDRSRIDMRFSNEGLIIDSHTSFK